MSRVGIKCPAGQKVRPRKGSCRAKGPAEESVLPGKRSGRGKCPAGQKVRRLHMS
jgi:hypothetical protein